MSIYSSAAASKTNPIKPNSNPIQTQFKPIKANFKAKQSQFKPNQTQFPGCSNERKFCDGGNTEFILSTRFG